LIIEGRYWLWLGARLIVGVVIVGWAASYLIPGGSGEKEFQKSLDAMKQVRTAHIATVVDLRPTQYVEMSWDLVCARDAYHYRFDLTRSGQASGGEANPEQTNDHEITQDEVHVGSTSYLHQSDDSWRKRYSGGLTANAVCQTLAQGTDSKLLPDIATMIKRRILDKGDKKTVNGVRCREWKVIMRGGPRGLEHDTVCLGLDDHLPYEMTVDWQGSHTLYSDYNSSLQLDLPAAIVRPANDNSTAN
jgi:hypothetical protein